MEALGAYVPLLIGYLLGSIPFGLLLVRLSGKGDLRDHGSGNIGATNALRAGGKGVGALVLLLDALKGAAAVIIARQFDPAYDVFGAAGAIVGHLYPVWLKFRGGKGVATLFGTLFALNWYVGCISLAVWLIAFLVIRISSVGGLAAAASAPIAAYAFGDTRLVLILLGFTLLIFWKHRANLKRLAAGTEPRIGSRKAKAPEIPGDDPPSRRPS